jgi:hypothetical protein
MAHVPRAFLKLSMMQNNREPPPFSNISLTQSTRQQQPTFMGSISRERDPTTLRGKDIQEWLKAEGKTLILRKYFRTPAPILFGPVTI